MKKVFGLFIAVMLGLNIHAQEVVYVDEYGNVLKNVVAVDGNGNTLKTKVNVTFEEALPLQRTSKQIVARTIGSAVIKTSSKIEVGKNYRLFEVAQAEDSALVGKSVVCQVVERRKSNLMGTEGRMVLRPLYIESGTQQIPLVPTDIFRRGKNISNFKLWLSPILLPLVFIAGSGAKITPEEYVFMTLAD